MTTIIQVEITRRCTASCYNAKRPHCECVCEGMNHGKGLMTALAQYSVLAQRLTLSGHRVRQPPAVQLTLFKEVP